jgi:hypothetical protein
MPLFGDFYHFEERGYMARQGQPKLAWAAVDLDKHASIEDFIAGCRKVHKGNAVRDAIKAEKRGYYSKFFDYPSYIPDVVAINISTPIRGGRPMTPHYTRTVEESGGYPSRIAPERVPSQAASWIRMFGLFHKLEGHKQGEVVSGEQLRAYLSLRRCGCFTFYGAFIGHADHLAEGIMYKMHFDLIGMLIAAREDRTGANASLNCLKGIRFIGYGEFYGIRPSMLMWKKRGLFEPVYLQCDYRSPYLVDALCRAAEHSPENPIWQGQCADMLATAAQRCLEEGRHEEAARAQAQLDAVSRRLAPRRDAATVKEVIKAT